MPAFDQAKLQNSLQYFIIPGRKVYVALSTGSDSTGDGSQNAPYATIGRGFQDIRDGANDILVVNGEGAFTPLSVHSEAIVRVSSKNNWLMVGIGDPWIGAPSNVTLTGGFLAVGQGIVDNMTRNSVFLIDVHFTVAHGLTTSDVVFLDGVPQVTPQRIEGFWEVFSIVDTETVRLQEKPGHTEAGVAGTAPYSIASGTTVGYGRTVNLTLNDCANVIIAGVNFTGATAVMIDGAATETTAGRNILISNCGFANSTLAWLGPNGDALLADLEFAGTFLQVERCVFSPSYAASNPEFGNRPSLWFEGGVDPIVNGCFFQHVNVFGPGSPSGVIRYNRSTMGAPKIGWILTDNTFENTQMPVDRIFGVANAHFNTSAPVDKVFFRRNFYTALASSGTTISGSAVLNGAFEAGDMVDPEPVPVPNSSFFNTDPSVVWAQSLQQAARINGSIGEHVSGLASASGLADCATSGQLEQAANEITASGNANWATATGFATPADVTAAANAIVASGDANWATAAGFATSGQVAAVALELATVSGDVAATAADVERLWDRNVRTRLYAASPAIVSGIGGALRNVPDGAVSHVEVQSKTDAQGGWGTPTPATYYVVLNYATGAAATDPSAGAEPRASAPTDGTFSLVSDFPG